MKDILDDELVRSNSFMQLDFFAKLLSLKFRRRRFQLLDGHLLSGITRPELQKYMTEFLTKDWNSNSDIALVHLEENVLVNKVRHGHRGPRKFGGNRRIRLLFLFD